MRRLGRALRRFATGRVARTIPALRLLAVGEVALLARRHVRTLAPAERRRLRGLLARRARRRALSADERAELRGLLAKLEGRAFAGGVAAALSPVPLPRRLREGPRRERVTP